MSATTRGTEPLTSPRTIAVLGNPNVGKSTLFNRISSARVHTSNFPGTTQDASVATNADSTIIDLPGIYALDLDTSESSVCRRVLKGELAPRGLEAHVPDTLLVVVDATNLMRNLTLVGEALALRLPTLIVVNMTDLAARKSIVIDTEALSECLGCPVVSCSARTGEGIQNVIEAMSDPRVPDRTPPTDLDALELWSEDIYAHVAAPQASVLHDRLTDRLDRAFTHPILGVFTFALVMTGFFYAIFKLAAIPMDLIDAWFGTLGGWIGSLLPEGAIRDLLVDGIIAGVGGTVIFLPQIVLLFFMLALLESTGYLARAAFVIDRVMRPFGLSGHSFVPLLSSHACAIPGIMAARAVPDPKDRLATILVAPFMSCTARIPVYVLLTGVLFPDRPSAQALAFTGCYVVGAIAGLLSALIARRTILRGRSRPMALELPSYRTPDIRAALMLTLDRAKVFLRKAGSMILAISIVLWWLGAYPQSDPPMQAVELREQAAAVVEGASELEAQADEIEARASVERSFLGRIGSTIEPVFEPLGYDRQLTIGVLASFAAREVFVSTMAIQITGSDDVEDDSIVERIATAQRDDGSPLFTPATSWSLLIFYILAMQCLPTLVVTAKEAGGWKWALLQLGWMSGLAYLGAAIAYRVVTIIG